jgi:hypothetical protein
VRHIAIAAYFAKGRENVGEYRLGIKKTAERSLFFLPFLPPLCKIVSKKGGTPEAQTPFLPFATSPV